jgi:hypothetical protein
MLYNNALYCLIRNIKFQFVETEITSMHITELKVCVILLGAYVHSHAGNIYKQIYNNQNTILRKEKDFP